MRHDGAGGKGRKEKENQGRRRSPPLIRPHTTPHPLARTRARTLWRGGAGVSTKDDGGQRRWGRKRLRRKSLAEGTGGGADMEDLGGGLVGNLGGANTFTSPALPCHAPSVAMHTLNISHRKPKNKIDRPSPKPSLTSSLTQGLAAAVAAPSPNHYRRNRHRGEGRGGAPKL